MQALIDEYRKELLDIAAFEKKLCKIMFLVFSHIPHMQMKYFMSILSKLKLIIF